MRRRGFSLIELMIVIGIIGILATVVLGSFNTARESARNKTAMAQLREISTAVRLLESDTGKWPNGCPPITKTLGNDLNDVADIAVDLTAVNVGLLAQPAVIITDNGTPQCRWTATESANWKGPYITVSEDPWGTPYRFDPDYRTDGLLKDNCGYGGTDNRTVVHSSGPNKSATDAYDCDDIVYMLYEGAFVPS